MILCEIIIGFQPISRIGYKRLVTVSTINMNGMLLADKHVTSESDLFNAI